MLTTTGGKGHVILRIDPGTAIGGMAEGSREPGMIGARTQLGREIMR